MFISIPMDRSWCPHGPSISDTSARTNMPHMSDPTKTCLGLAFNPPTPNGQSINDTYNLHDVVLSIPRTPRPSHQPNATAHLTPLISPMSSHSIKIRTKEGIEKGKQEKAVRREGRRRRRTSLEHQQRCIAMSYNTILPSPCQSWRTCPKFSSSSSSHGGPKAQFTPSYLPKMSCYT